MTKQQLKKIHEQSKSYLKSSSKPKVCFNCKIKIPNQAKFCPECGSSVEEVDKSAAINISYKVPEKGIAIEFAESSSGGFPSALKKYEKALKQMWKSF